MENINLVKKNTILLNSSRGGVIKEETIIYGIKNNNISSGWLDVFENDPYFGNLTNYSNLVLTPHIGSYSKEIRSAMEYEATLNLVKFFKGQ